MSSLPKDCIAGTGAFMNSSHFDLRIFIKSKGSEGMAKKKKNKKAALERERAGKRKKLIIIYAIVAVSVLAAAIALSIDGKPGPTALADRDESLRRGETRDTLEPSMFRHPTVRAAYQVAREIPWVLDSIYCFCFCEENPAFRHKSLLSCYVDEHASA